MQGKIYTKIHIFKKITVAQLLKLLKPQYPTQEYQFESQLLHMQPSFLLTCQGKH